DCGDEEWQLIAGEPAHPQHLNALLLRALEIDRKQVGEWPHGGRSPAASGRTTRVRLVGEAVWPGALTARWGGPSPQPPEALPGLTRYDGAARQDEAVAIAMLLRRALDIPGATASLVTPDRELARRVAAELRRWDIDIDDSAGVPLNRTPPG